MVQRHQRGIVALREGRDTLIGRQVRGGGTAHVKPHAMEEAAMAAGPAGVATTGLAVTFRATAGVQAQAARVS